MNNLAAGRVRKHTGDHEKEVDSLVHQLANFRYEGIYVSDLLAPRRKNWITVDNQHTGHAQGVPESLPRYSVNDIMAMFFEGHESFVQAVTIRLDALQGFYGVKRFFKQIELSAKANREWLFGINEREIAHKNGKAQVQGVFRMRPTQNNGSYSLAYRCVVFIAHIVTYWLSCKIVDMSKVGLGGLASMVALSRHT